MYKKIDRCRICGSVSLKEVLDLGTQALTGVFPRSRAEPVSAGPLRLVKCQGEGACGLLQLQHSYDLGELYGENYGYRSGLNASMVKHLNRKVAAILARISIGAGDLVIDVGSNDGTTLGAYPASGATLVGIDPTGAKFAKYYPPGVQLIPDFFSSSRIRELVGDRKATVITSFSMFYDLENPVQFAREVAEVLADDGIWIFEQSYMPTMLARNSYDTVCHEHLEYYALKQIDWIMERASLQIIDVEFNDINGGSFSVTAAKQSSSHSPSAKVAEARSAEAALALDTLRPYQEFAGRVSDSREALRDFVDKAKRSGKKISALGASTKGNVILQYCGFADVDVEQIGEVNSEKFGCFTPGTLIPIVPENELLALRPDFLVVLPWHFREFFVGNTRFAGSKLVFPLPVLDVS